MCTVLSTLIKCFESPRLDSLILYTEETEWYETVWKRQEIEIERYKSVQTLLYISSELVLCGI